MTSQDNTIDVEVTHVEENDELIPLEEIDPEMTSGIAIVTPEQYIERAPERRAAETEMTARAMHPVPEEDCEFCADEPSSEVAVLADLLPVVADPDELEFKEDLAVLRVLTNKIFRRAITDDATMTEPPLIERAARRAKAHKGLTLALRDLDEAREGRDDVSVRLADWKQALA